MTQQFDTDEWPQVVFNGKPLPQTFKAISILWSFADVPEAVGEWILDLHYCAGRKRTADAEECHQNAQVILNYLIENRTLVQTEIDERLGEHGFVGAPTFSEWVEGFSIIRDSAVGTEECNWIAPVSEARVQDSKLKAQRFMDILNRPDEPDRI